jgi:hypothetical protein
MYLRDVRLDGHISQFNDGVVDYDSPGITGFIGHSCRGITKPAHILSVAFRQFYMFKNIKVAEEADPISSLAVLNSISDISYTDRIRRCYHLTGLFNFKFTRHDGPAF